MIIKYCIKCKKEFKSWPSNNRKYCSVNCAKQVTLKNLKSDNWLGKKRPDVTGEKQWQWKGNNVGYDALHSWLRRTFGNANKCDNPKCIYPRKNSKGVLLLYPKKFFWANVSGNYKRDISDWRQSCNSCNQLDGIPKANMVNYRV